MPFEATWMQLKILILCEVRQTVKDKQHLISLICGIKKKDTNELICRTEIDSQTEKLMITKGDRWCRRRDGLGA